MSERARWTHEQPSVTYLERVLQAICFTLSGVYQSGLETVTRNIDIEQNQKKLGPQLNIYWGHTVIPSLSRKSSQFPYNYCRFRFE